FQKEIEKEARDSLHIKKALTAGVETEVTLDPTDPPSLAETCSRLSQRSRPCSRRVFFTAPSLPIPAASSPTNILLLTTFVFAATIMVLAGCLTADEARNSLSWEVLITVAISFGLGQAMQNSGAADLVANALVKAAEPTGEVGLMTALHFVFVLLNAILTNNAAVAVLFPIVNAACKAKGYNFFPFLIVLMLAGSADFSTPIGYQCNLMVYGAKERSFAALAEEGGWGHAEEAQGVGKKGFEFGAALVAGMGEAVGRGGRGGWGGSYGGWADRLGMEQRPAESFGAPAEMFGEY
ncbi:Phosphoinositide phosphatase sac1, partial [Phlyctochytrium bullatum]